MAQYENSAEIQRRKWVGYALKDIRRRAQGISLGVVEQVRAVFEQAKENETLDPINYPQHFVTLVQIARRTGVTGEGDEVKKTVDDLFGDLLVELPQFTGKMDVRAVANILHALASLSYSDKETIRSLLYLLRGKTDTLNPQEVANMLFALAILEVVPHRGSSLIKLARDMISAGSITNRAEIMQLKEFHMATDLLPQIDPVFDRIRPSLQLDRKVSRVARGIQQLVKGILSTQHPEYKIEENVTLLDIFEADVLVTHGDNQRTDIEIDDPLHVLFELRDKFRDKILKKVGGIDTVRLSTLPPVEYANSQIIDGNIRLEFAYPTRTSVEAVEKELRLKTGGLL